MYALQVHKHAAVLLFCFENVFLHVLMYLQQEDPRMPEQTKYEDAPELTKVTKVQSSVLHVAL